MGSQIGPVQFPRILAVDRPYIGTLSQIRGTEERFYIGNDRGTLCGVREGANREPLRNPKAASIPHVQVTVRPYTLKGWEERSQDHWATFCGGGPPMSVYFVSGSSRIRIHVLVIRRRTP